ncbi:MAG: CocE/NonD family hydrolase [Bacteroidales bacterium]
MKTKPILKSLLFIVIIVSALPINGLKAQSLAGDWYGSLEVQGMFLRLNLHFTQTTDGYTGAFDSPDQGAFGIPLSTVTLTGQKLSFTFAQGGIDYQGFTDPGFTNIIGTFKQGTLKEPMSYSRTPVEMPEGSPTKIKEIYDKQEVCITMRDGVKLFTSLYTPKNVNGPAPMIMVRSPYNSEPGGVDQFNFSVSVYYRLIKEGYILVFQDVRGRYMSEGKFVNVRPFNPDKKGTEIDESSDTYDTAEWLVKNVKSNNGRIGVMGVSYTGFYSTMAILANHPAIKAVSPQAPVTNWFIGDDWHHNGAFMMLDGFSFYTQFGDPMAVPTRQNNSGFRFPVPDSYEFFMRLGNVKSTRQFFADSVKYWQELLEHPNYDAWWKATDPRPYLKKVQPAVMTVGGWFDAEDLWGTLHTYEAIEEQNSQKVKNTLVMGPWSHGQWAMGDGENLGNIYWGSKTNEYYHKLEVDFFNYYLKDQGTPELPEATIFITGANEWKSFETWPPKNTEEKSIFFQPGGKLDFSAPLVADNFDEYLSDPMKPVPYREDVAAQRDAAYMTDDQRFASRRPDVMVYQTEVLTEDMTFTGPLTAELYVTTTGTDADWVVKLVDVFPDRVPAPAGKDIKVPLGGYQMLVRGEVMRGRYRNSYEKPEAFKPGKITRVKFELPDIAHKFKKGHRIMIQVQNSWFPLIDRNPQKFVDIYTCEVSDFQKATMRVYHDKKNASCVKVNVLKD